MKTSTPITFNLIKEILFYPRKALKKVLRIDTKLAYWLVPVLAVISTFLYSIIDPVWTNDLLKHASAVGYLDKVLTNSLIITFFTYLTAMIYLIISKLAKVKKVLFENCLKIVLASTLPSLLLLPFGLLLPFVLLDNIAVIWSLILIILMFSEFTKFSKIETFFWYIIFPIFFWVLIGLVIFIVVFIFSYLLTSLNLI